MKTQKIIKKYYPAPYKNTYGKVFTKNGTMAFDFTLSKDTKDYNADEGIQELVLKILNDKYKATLSFEGASLIYEKGKINIKNNTTNKQQTLLLVRGWGNLIGIDGHNLSIEEASKIQDTFGNWIVNKLTKISEQ